MSLRILYAAAFFAAAGIPHLVNAKVSALVVGISEYDTESNLDGTIGDADDIAQALENIAAHPIRVLKERDATKSAIKRAYDDLLANSSAGDTIVFSFAGHGAQEPAQDPDEEPDDGKDEFLPLSGFDPKGSADAKRERIVDDELRAWFSRAKAKDVKVVFVADTCHSGGMSRSSVTLKTRLAKPVTFKMPPASDDMKLGAGVKERDLDNLIFLAASLESQLTPEVKIGNEFRGALSYGFSRALEGAADSDGDGDITRHELQVYLDSIIQSESKGMQTPVYRPRMNTGASEVVFSTRSIAKKKVAIALPSIPELSRRDDGAVVAADGDVIAFKADEDQFDRISENLLAIEHLKQLSRAATLTISAEPKKSEYFMGERIRFRSKDWRFPNVIAFNLANSGEIQPLFDAQGGMQELVFEADVTTPFGADHLVVITSDRPLGALSRAMDGQRMRGGELADRLQLFLDDAQIQVGILPLFTREVRCVEGFRC